MSLLGTYLLAVVLLLITPGPVIALVTHTAVRDGYRRAFITLAGTNLASLVLLAMAVMILAGIVDIHPLSLAGVGFIGALFIGWMGIGMLTHRSPRRQHRRGKAAFLPVF
jgi:threonine/homoserine/homoserine lactone efflux protein